MLRPDRAGPKPPGARQPRLRHLALGRGYAALRCHHGLLLGRDLLRPGAGFHLIEVGLGGYGIGLGRSLHTFERSQVRLGLLALRLQQGGVEDDQLLPGPDDVALSGVDHGDPTETSAATVTSVASMVPETTSPPFTVSARPCHHQYPPANSANTINNGTTRRSLLRILPS